MHKTHILIIGAGPAGLACAHELSAKGAHRYKADILEADEQVGGLSKTADFDGYRYDLGSHRFFSKIKDVNDLWNHALKDNFIAVKRYSRIYYMNQFYDYPLRIRDVVYKLGLPESLIMGFSYLKMRLFPFKEEKNFSEWISNRFGRRLYETFFKTYTEKVWGMPCDQISAEWAAQRIRKLSLFSVIRNSIQGSDDRVKSLIREFRYPRYGSGMMYDSLRHGIETHPDFRVITGSKVDRLTYRNGRWVAGIKGKNGRSAKAYDHVVSTMPLPELISCTDHTPEKIRTLAARLRFRSLIVVCLVFSEPNIFKDTWIYLHDSSVKSNRLQVLNNWGPDMVAASSHSSYGCEYICSEGDYIWNMADKELIGLAINELKLIKIIPERSNCIKANVLRARDAYPVYDGHYSNGIASLRKTVRHMPNLQVAGRGGMFRYNNMDHSIYTGILAARNIVEGREQHDLWRVSQDNEYCEKKPDH
ncbi:MAG: NAD(P)/FAD-dependent oxidoreductase [archaeon]